MVIKSQKIFSKAKTPFRFYTQCHLTELIGLKASTLDELLQLLRTVPGSSIYHHTHRYLQQHQYLSPEPPNDFAYWVREILGDEKLGEMLGSIDTVQFLNIRSLREKLVSTIEFYLKGNPKARLKFADEGEEFHFMKSISFALPTSYAATDLHEFADILKKIPINSIYYHIFEAKLRLEKPTNDFSFWIENALGDEILAEEISRLDPYTYTLEDLRKTILKLIRKRISFHVETG